MYERIVASDYDRCGSEPWKHISDRAKDLVLKLLEPDRTKRLTAEQVRDACCIIQHPAF